MQVRSKSYQQWRSYQQTAKGASEMWPSHSKDLKNRRKMSRQMSTMFDTFHARNSPKPPKSVRKERACWALAISTVLCEPKSGTQFPFFPIKNSPNSEERGIYTNPSLMLWPKLSPFLEVSPKAPKIENFQDC